MSRILKMLRNHYFYLQPAEGVGISTVSIPRKYTLPVNSFGHTFSYMSKIYVIVICNAAKKNTMNNYKYAFF